MNMNDMKNQCDEVAALLKQFAHPQRLLILCLLSEGEKHVGEIQEAVELSQSQTSQFLKRMQAEGLVSSRRDKNFSYYAIASDEVMKLLKALKKIFC